MAPATALSLTTITGGFEVIRSFISVAEEIAKLASLALPQYQAAAADMHQVCPNILDANKNLLRVINGFVYFDFEDADYRKDFSKLYKSYKDLKVSADFQKFKFSCGDINNVYRANIEDKIGGWFGDQRKQEEVKGIFEQMTNVDRTLEELIYNRILSIFEDYIDQIRNLVSKDNKLGAEEKRFELERTFDPIIEELAKFNGALADLVVQFANKARVPITLRRS
jgi:hypothetical protein